MWTIRPPVPAGELPLKMIDRKRNTMHFENPAKSRELYFGIREVHYEYGIDPKALVLTGDVTMDWNLARTRRSQSDVFLN